MLGARTSRAEGEGVMTREGAMAKMLHLLLDWEYPHWMMMAGTILVAAGFIGLAFHRNRNVETDQKKPGRERAKSDGGFAVGSDGRPLSSYPSSLKSDG